MGEDTVKEAILEPDLPIIDPHHHLWDFRPLLSAFPEPRDDFIATIALSPYYGFDALHADTTSGHNVIATVFMECGAFYRAGAGDALKVLGEVEYVNGVAAQGASGLYGNFRPCAGIVGHTDLLLGAAAGEVLDALQAVTPRFKGIRHRGAWDADETVLGAPFNHFAHLYADPRFREGFAQLAQRGLTFDAFVLEPQIADVTALARAFPQVTIVLDHCGTPLNTGPYRGHLHERFDVWRSAIRELASCPNVSIKLGGLAMSQCGMPEQGPEAGLSSEVLAAMWRPYIETCIEAFGPERGMFESNYPVDKWGASYATLWNAFKRLSAGASADEKHALFAGTAARVYGIEGVLAAFSSK
jgi:predicted TIM-barrel fold metal-dependent hydrolase